MSEAELPAPAADPKKRNPLFKLVFGALGVIAVIVGVMQMTRGVKQMFGAGVSAEVEQLVKESDEAVAAANEHILAATPLFQGLLNAVDAQPLAAVRSEQREAAEEASEHFTQAGEQLRLAAKKLDDARAHEMADKLKTYLADKSRSYVLLAQVSDGNREMIRLVLDDSIAATNDLVTRLTEVAGPRDAAEKEAAAISAQAEAAVKQE